MLSLVVGLAAACAPSSETPPPTMGSATPITSSSVTMPLVPSPVDAATPDAEASSKDAKLVRSMLKRVAERRELAAKSEVIGATIPRKTIISQIREHVLREVPKSAIDHEGAVLKMLGLIPPTLDYEKETFALLEAQIAGYYEPADKRMYLADDLAKNDATATLAHELVHALQDQHYDLGARSKYSPGKSDKSAATSCLAEGDAMSAMFDVMTGAGKALSMPAGMFSQLVEAGLATGPGANAPPAMKRSLVAPYAYGTEFVHALRREGGWKLVDDAWTNPPTTTEQILHPDKWKKHEPPLDVAPFPVPEGFAVDDEDTGGELGLRIAMEEWVGQKDGPGLATAWGGDRTTLLRRGNDLVLAWQVRLDSAKGAPARKLEKTLGAAWSKKWKGDPLCTVGPSGNLGVRALSDGEYVVVAGPTNASTFQSSGDCVATKKLLSSAVPTSAAPRR